MVKKEYLCDSCFYADIEITESYVPIYASSSRCNKVQQYNVWCKKKCTYIRKLINVLNNKKCGYRPKAGVINKHLTQKQLI